MLRRWAYHVGGNQRSAELIISNTVQQSRNSVVPVRGFIVFRNSIWVFIGITELRLCQWWKRTRSTELELCRPSPWVYCFSELDLVLYRDNKVPTLSWSIEFLPRYLISSFDKKKQSTEKRLQLATTESELCRPSPWVYCFSELDLGFYRDDRAPTLSMVNSVSTETSNPR